MLNYFGWLLVVLGGWKEKKSKKLIYIKNKSDLSQINPIFLLEKNKNKNKNKTKTKQNKKQNKTKQNKSQKNRQPCMMEALIGQMRHANPWVTLIYLRVHPCGDRDVKCPEILINNPETLELPIGLHLVLYWENQNKNPEIRKNSWKITPWYFLLTMLLAASKC